MKGYCYRMLTETEQKICLEIETALTGFCRQAVLSGNLQEASAALECLFQESPELYYVDIKNPECLYEKDGKTILNCRYLYSPENAAAIQLLLEQRTSEILTIAGIHMEDTDIMKAGRIHDYLVSQVQNFSTGGNFSYCREHSEIVGPLLFNEGTVEGICKAFTFLAHRAGLQAMMVLGFLKPPAVSEITAHAWNIVAVEGEYSHIDICLDSWMAASGGSGLEQRSFFLLPDIWMPDHIQISNGPVCTEEYPFMAEKTRIFHTVSAFESSVETGLLDETEGSCHFRIMEEIPDASRLGCRIRKIITDRICHRSIPDSIYMRYNPPARLFTVQRIIPGSI